VWLKLWWDGREQPSVDCPLPLFFGAGTLYNRDGREFLVKAFPVNIRFDEERVHLAYYFPMPFSKSMKGQLVSKAGVVPDVQWSVRYGPLDGPANHYAYFHATYKDHPNPERGKDNVLLDTRKRHTVRAAEMHEADYSPWEGRDLAAWPSLTMLRGKIVVDNGTFSGDLKDGQFLPRKVPEEIRARPAL